MTKHCFAQVFGLLVKGGVMVCRARRGSVKLHGQDWATFSEGIESSEAEQQDPDVSDWAGAQVAREGSPKPQTVALPREATAADADICRMQAAP